MPKASAVKAAKKEIRRRSSLVSAMLEYRLTLFQEKPTAAESTDDILVTDLLADIRHFCDDHELDFGELDRRACGCYLKEIRRALGVA